MVNPIPVITRDDDGFNRVLATVGTLGLPALGVDLEFNPTTLVPTILGVASRSLAWAGPWDREKAARVLAAAPAARLVAYSGIGADRPIFEAAGLKTPLEHWDDPIIKVFLCNPDWASAPGKEEDEADSGTLGYYNLGASATYYTDLPMYKRHCGPYCSGMCPVCDKEAYCALDAYAGLLIDDACSAEMRRYGIPEALYRRRVALTEYCRQISDKGVAVDREFVTKMDAEIAASKLALFPFEWITTTTRGKKNPKIVPLKNPRKHWLTPFNPASGPQVAAYFESVGLTLKNRGKVSTDRNTVRRVLERELKKLGVDWTVDRFGSLTILEESMTVDLPTEIDLLYRLDQSKRLGKGLLSWFDDTYFGADGLLHPRFNTIGASTTRLSSSDPNCFDGETEILTTAGWVLIKDVTLAHKVAQWENHTISFVNPTLITSRRYTGDMVSLENLHINLRVTEDHRCLTQNRKTGKFRVTKAVDYPTDSFQYHAGLVEDGARESRCSLTDDELRFLIAVQADGSLTKTRIDFSFHKARKIARLEALLNRLDFVYTKRESGKHTRFLLSRGEAPWLDFYLPNKRFNHEMLGMLSLSQVSVILDEVCHWDGNWERRDCYYSSSEENADFIQAVASLGGIRALKRLYTNARGSRSHQVFFTDTDRSLTTNISKRLTPVVDEQVYCLSVPSSFVVVRRQGRVCVVGQCQNIPARGGMSIARRAIIPRDKSLRIVKADFSSLEFRVCLWYAGYDGPITSRVFEELAESSGGLFDKAAAQNGMKVRDIAKSVVHATDYLEGVVTYKPHELESPKIRGDREAGALYVCDGKDGRPAWEMSEGIVCFTGANLAERLFGEKTRAKRKLALDIQEVFHKKYPMIRRWHQKTSEQIDHKYVRTHDGHRLPLHGTASENLKVGVACLGQGGGASYAQEAMLRFAAEGRVVTLQVHDEFVDELPREWSDKQCVEYMSLMTQPSLVLPGFTCPVKVSAGDNWKDTSEI